MLKIKDNVDLKELEKFGFEDNVFTKKGLCGEILYQVVITSTHHYLQIRRAYFSNVASSLQDLFYDLIQANMVEKVSD